MRRHVIEAADRNAGIGRKLAQILTRFPGLAPVRMTHHVEAAHLRAGRELGPVSEQIGYPNPREFADLEDRTDAFVGNADSERGEV